MFRGRGKKELQSSGTVRIDGSYGEGGGQIIRTCLSLAALTGRAFEVVNVRAGRPKPGLQAQHLTAVQSTAQICGAHAEGAHIGSSSFLFAPQHSPISGQYNFEVGTAGATTLIAQTLVLPLSCAQGKSHVQISGGTHVPFAPVADYLESVYLELLRRLGMSATSHYEAAGYYPKGGGKLVLEIDPSAEIRPVNLVHRGRLLRLSARIITSRLPEHVGRRGALAVQEFMRSAGHDVETEQINPPSCAPGAAVFIQAECEGGIAGFSALGQVGKPMERVARDACQEFLAWWESGAPCDERLADQLVLPMAFASGISRWVTRRVTDHLRTVVWVVEQFLPVSIGIEERADGLAEIAVRSYGR